MEFKIIKKDTNEIVGKFVSNSKNHKKAFYQHMKFTKYGLSATECYFRPAEKHLV